MINRSESVMFFSRLQRVRNVQDIFGRNKIFISILMPTYNEHEYVCDAIRNIEEQLDGLGYGFEILVIDDGSTDETYDVINRLNLLNVKIIRFSRNQGKGFALRYGLDHANGDFVFFIDSDMEIKTENLENYLDALKTYDLAIASKWHPQSKYEAPFLRKILSLFFQFLVKILVGVKATDTQSGLKAGKIEPLRKIFSLLLVKRYAFDVELLVVAQLLNCRLLEMPVDIHMGAGFSPIEALRMLVDLLAIAYRLRVKKWYQRSITNRIHMHSP